MNNKLLVDETMRAGVRVSSGFDCVLDMAP
jgi:hypothetical protein